MQTEVIIEAIGAMSRFQIIMLPLIYGPGVLMSWGMLMMSFAGASPQWWCVSTLKVDSETGYLFIDNMTSAFCPPAKSNTSCRFAFSQDMITVVSEWNLVCDESRTPAFITSIQMLGVMTGAFLGGQCADIIGRKPIYYTSMLLGGVFNLVAGFSVSWQMFASLRFFIGMMIGSLIVVGFPYFMEFIGQKWRPICSAVPFWTVGACLMAFASWLRPNWSHQHIILAALHVPFLLGWFLVPESLRWLTVKGRLDEAEKVVDQICRYNRREKPDNTRALLEHVAEEEQRRRESGRKYTYIDVYRGCSTCWRSLAIQFVWMCLALVYYGITFGVGRLSGSLYLNMFLLFVIEIPGAISTFFLNNKIGRRYTCFLFFVTALVGSFSVVITTRVAPDDLKGTIITGLSLVTKLGVAAAWCAVQVLTTETYPTVIRNLGYGAANTAARIGGIIAPFVFAVDRNDLMIPFIIVGSAMAACAILSLLMRETKGIPLADTIQDKGNVMEKNDAVKESDVIHTKI